MADKKWRFRIHNTSTDAIEHTIDSSQLASAPIVGGQTVLPLEGRTETRPSLVQVLDDNDFFTSKLADSGGRMVLLRRLADVQVSVDGGAFNTLFTGRIADIQDRVRHYDVTLHDERLLERTEKVFTQLGAVVGSGSSSEFAGTFLVPPGIDGEYGGFGFEYKLVTLTAAGSTEGNLVKVHPDKVIFDGLLVDHASIVPPEVLEIIRNDLKESIQGGTTEALNPATTVGNFNNLRCRIDGVDREVFGFGRDRPRNIDELTAAFEVLGEDNNLQVWVVWSTSTGQPSSEARLHMSTGEPTALMPLHVGGERGIHPFQFAQNIYEEIGVRFSTAAMQALIDNTFYGLARWRIKGPEIAANWLEEHVYKPYGVVPFIDADGKIAPKSIFLPRSSDLAGDVATLPLFQTSGVGAQPTWQHSARDQVTTIRVKYTQESILPISVVTRIQTGGGAFSGLRQVRFANIDNPSGFGADLIREEERDITFDHDITFPGTREVDYTLDSVHFRGFPFGVGGQVITIGALKFARFLEREVFNRFGDGPIRGSLVPTSSGSSSQALSGGDFIRINMPTFPDPETRTRGGIRIVQILSAIQGDVPEFDWLDVAPSTLVGSTESPILSAPTVQLTSSTSSPKHSLIADITALTTGAKWQLQMAVSTAGEPATTSPLWRAEAIGTTANSTGIVVSNLLANSSNWGRARQTAPNRITSDWSTAAQKDTAALLAPSNLAVSSITSRSAKATWDVGEPSGIVEIHLDQSSTCATATLRIYQSLRAGSNFINVFGLSPDSTHCIAVRHRDDFGGFSDFSNKVSFESLVAATSRDTAPAIKAFALTQGTICP